MIKKINLMSVALVALMASNVSASDGDIDPTDYLRLPFRDLEIENKNPNSSSSPQLESFLTAVKNQNKASTQEFDIESLVESPLNLDSLQDPSVFRAIWRMSQELGHGFVSKIKPCIDFYNQINQNVYNFTHHHPENQDIRPFWSLMVAIYWDVKDKAAQTWLSMATDSRVNEEYRLSAASFLGKAGEEYKDKAVQAWLSIATDSRISEGCRFEAAKALGEFGAEHKDQIAQAWLSIATDSKLSEGCRFEAAKTLGEFGAEHKDQIAQAWLSIATDSSVSDEYKIDAANALGYCFDGDYKNQAAEVFLSMAIDSRVSEKHRLYAGNALSALGEEYKNQAAQAWLSIATDFNKFGAEHKDQIAQALLDIIIHKDTDNSYRAKAIEDFAQLEDWGYKAKISRS